MSPFLANALTLVIVLVILFLYRRADRDNRSLDRVRKFGEKMRDELSLFVDRRSEDLQRFGIELDVKQQAARVALDKLQAVQEHLDSRTESLEAIQRRLSEYDSTLARLVDATTRVDQNLERLEGEGKFIDSVNRKLDTARKSLDAIEHELPLLRNQFLNDATESLESFRDGLLSDVEGSLVQTKQALAMARDEGLGAVEQARTAREEIVSIFGEAFATARREAESLEGEVYAMLREASEARAALLRQNIEERFSSVGQMARSRSEEIEEAQTRLHEEWQAESNALHARLTAGNATLDAETAEKLTKISKLVSDAESAASEAQDTAQGAVYRASTELQALSTTLTEGISAMRDEALAAYRDRMDRVGEEMAARFAAMDGENTRIAERIQQLAVLAEERQSRLEEDFAAFGQALEDNRLRFEESLRGEMADLRSGMEHLAAGLGELRADAFAQTQARLSLEEKAFFEGLAERGRLFDAAWQSWMEKLQERMEGLATQYAQTRENLEKERAATLDRLLAERIEGFTVQAEAALSAESGRQEQRMDALAVSLVAEEESLRQALESAKQEGLHARESFAEELRKTEIAATARVGELEATLRALVDAARTEYEEQRSVFDRAAEADRRRLEEDLAQLTSKCSALAAQASTLQEAQAFKDSLVAQIGELTSSLAGIESRRAAVAEVENSFRKIASLQEETAQRMSGMLAQRTKIDAFEAEVRKLASLQDSVQARLAGLGERSDELIELQARLGRLQETASGLDGRIERMERKAPIVDTTVEGIDRAFTRIESVQKSLSGIETGLEPLQARLTALSGRVDDVVRVEAEAGKAIALAKELATSLEESRIRTAELRKAREWIARAETRLQELDREAGERLKLLADLLETKPVGDWTQLPATTQEMVRKLARQGWTSEEIARTVRLSRSEVELILELESPT